MAWKASSNFTELEGQELTVPLPRCGMGRHRGYVKLEKKTQLASKLRLFFINMERPTCFLQAERSLMLILFLQEVRYSIVG